MPRVHVLKAAKAYPEIGVVKGDVYYKWTNRVTVGKSYRGVVHRSRTRPSRAQLTSSDFMREVFSIEDGMSPETPDDLESTVADIEQLKSDQEEKLENMPEGLREGDTGQMIQERIDALQDWADRIEEAKQSWENAAEGDNYGDPDNSEFGDHADNTSYEGP